MIPAYDSPGRKRLRAIGKKITETQAGLTPWAEGEDWAREAHRVYGDDGGHIVGLTVSCNYFRCNFSNGMNRLADGDEYVVLLVAFKIR
jgi:hypothetical protein